MDVNFVAKVGGRLKGFLGRFSDCFNRSEPREHLETYVRGQISSLERKSIEPMALEAGTPPRTLQRFLEQVEWNESRLRDRMQQLVAEEHADPKAIGIIDESGNPKNGKHTACVDRQWCGNTGKIDNCVVAVHTSYVAGDFHCLLDSDLYMAQSWANDLPRRQAAYIPDDVEFRTKPEIALEQVRRALGNGIRVAAWTFDELYGRGSEFLDGLQGLGQNYVGEVPSTFTGWLTEPQVLHRPTPQEMRKRGPKRKFPRLAKKSSPACEVRNLVKHSPIFRQQHWQPFRIKDGQKGPMVWEVKHAPFYRKHDDGLPSQAHCLIVARNVLDPQEVKYFVSNMLPSTPEVSIEWLLWIAFSRHPIEDCFRQAKDELGMDHFEVRGWRSIHRHFYISQLSHLFCSRVCQELQIKKNEAEPVLDGRNGSRGGIGLCRRIGVAAVGAHEDLSKGGQQDHVPPTSQSTSSQIAYEVDSPATMCPGHRDRQTTLVRTGRHLVG